MSSFVVTSWLCPSFKSEGVTQTGGVESDGSLTQAPGQQAGLGWTGKTGWCHRILPRVAVAIFGVSCSTYSHSSQSREALGPAGAGAVGGISRPSTGQLWVSASNSESAPCSPQGGPILGKRGPYISSAVRQGGIIRMDRRMDRVRPAVTVRYVNLLTVCAHGLTSTLSHASSHSFSQPSLWPHTGHRQRRVAPHWQVTQAHGRTSHTVEQELLFSQG